jgi:glycosyltransferase involved in cell wall biosynthesis
VREVEEGLPAARLHFLANTGDNQTAMEADGLSAVFCNHNAFVDERRIRLVRPGRRTHDALYLARLSPFKRHHLAKAIPSLYLIGRPRPGERAYGDGVLRDLQHAHWVEAVRYSRLTHHFSRAAVGLCLSRAEGAMYASIEYLLAGLPVVSTRSLGGRDVFFDPEFVTIADDTPESVWDSVQTLKSRGLSAQAIRKATIPRLQRHRERFDALINGILTERGGGLTFRWEEARHHKLGLWCNVPAKQFRRSNPLLIWARKRLG